MMLSIDVPRMGQALEEVGRSDVCVLAGALTTHERRELLPALERLKFQPAARLVGEVCQDFDLLVLSTDQPSQAAAPAPLLALVETYAELLRATATAVGADWLTDFMPTDISLQRYRRGASGISPHRDSRQFVRLISIFSLGSPAEFRLFRDRRGSPLARHNLNSGDLLILRAPGFANRSAVGPLHSVSGPADGVRYSITIRMKEAAASPAS
jgi:2OG-Fe(II) oxygenase superfamily